MKSTKLSVPEAETRRLSRLVRKAIRKGDAQIASNLARILFRRVAHKVAQ